MAERLRILVDGEPVEIAAGASLLETMLSVGVHPTGGGCLCAAGDCPHCLATVDGIGYVRSCQVPARNGMTVARDHLHGGEPGLALGAPPAAASDRVPVRYLRCDVLVIGQGASGRAARVEAEAEGRRVLAFDAGRGEEVIGIYPGPLVVVRTPEAMIHVEPEQEIVVATGAMEIQPVAPGNALAGIVTARAAEALARAGIELGTVVAIGAPPAGVPCEAVAGTLVRFEGDDRVEAVVVADGSGEQQRHPCDTVSVGLGLTPRDVLARMASGIGGPVRVRVVGDAALEPLVPPCPREGTVCPCAGVTVEQLDSVWQRGFHEMELFKRATLAGTGTCQGAACLPYLRSFLADRGEALQPPFTARPLSRQRTIAEVAAGAYHHATPRTALDAEHRRAGATMERAGGWFRPWSYGDPDAEYRAVREGVSIGDVSTLGKMLVSGPDALELLERLYPTRVATIRPGRSRYALLLDERGYVLDDGMICCEACPEGEKRFRLTFTSGGSTLGELWMRDWAESWGLDVRLMNQTMSLGAINVTGPRAAELLGRLGTAALPAFGDHGPACVGGVDCHVYRLSFTGELSYELHHPARDSVPLWRALLAAGAELHCIPHGLEALLRLRLEKGHLLVGQDTDYDSTPRRLHHEWAVARDKDDFVGRLSVRRTDRIPLDRQLVGLYMESPAPIEGAVIWHRGEYAGYVTSAADSPTLGGAVMLGWVRTLDDDGTLPEEVTIDDRPARRSRLPFYDPEGARARVEVGAPLPPASVDAAPARSVVAVASESAAAAPGDRDLVRVDLVRVVARPAALDAWLPTLDPETVALRVAPDEALLLGAPVRGAHDAGDLGMGPLDPHALDDRDAIVEPEAGFAAAWFPADEAAAILEATCEWALPDARPAFAQGAVADLPVKLWLEVHRVLFLVPAPYATDLQERIAWVERPSCAGDPS